MKLLATILLFPLMLPAQELKSFDKLCAPGDLEYFGLTCSEDDPCPIFLELAGVEASGEALFLTGNLHSVSTTMFGLLLVTADRGKTWLEPDQRIRSAELEQIQFVDREHGWVSGEKLEPLPKDPFLLITDDGGKTWKPTPVFTDTHYGSITQFWFDSLTEGQLVLDASQGQKKRFERYETHTGGISWEQKETADHEIRLEHAKSGSPNWRVRIEGDAYQVETRSSGDWESVARFAARAGECK